VIEVNDYSFSGYRSSQEAPERATAYCEQLERGEILYFPDSLNLVSESARGILTSLPADALAHKNISYSPAVGKLAGLRGTASADIICDALKQYSDAAISFCAGLLLPYAKTWRVELCSFRPTEERGRQLSLHERNDLLHIDAFPGRPGNGARILRMFTNIHPQQSRAWLTSDPMPMLCRDSEFAVMIRTSIRKADSISQRAAANIIRTARRAGLGIPDRSPYDRVMLQLHNEMKSSTAFQAECTKYRHEFKPGTSWLVFTDTVPHAVLEGQFALEQSFFVPRKALVMPEAAPLSIIETAAGHSMV
jgi:3-deoxy-D-manno-oct-2-ulosonic acid (Kdo) hydroxylase